MQLIRVCTRSRAAVLLFSVALAQPTLAQKTALPVHVDKLGVNGQPCTPLTPNTSTTSLASTPVRPYGSLTPKPVLRVPEDNNTDAHENEGDDPNQPPALHDLGPENNEDGARDFMQDQGDNQNAMAANSTSTSHGAGPTNSSQGSQTTGPTSANGTGCKPAY